ncbi:MAG: class I SAM-dependent methyltransferase [Chloroflexi bacterium]|nr:class I SAM-dependent methyltransferase [Chloroflexota bacterium]
MTPHTQADAGGILDYFAFSVALGIRSLKPGFYREPLARIINPLSYIRGTEFSLVFKEIDASSGDRILDIGSPKMAFLYLAAKSEARIYATDIRDYFIGPAEIFLRGIGVGDSIGSRLVLDIQDARSMTYPDGFFDKIFSISVIEHIPDDGDTKAMAEIGRTLRPGGIACLTVPYRHEGYSEEFRDEVFGQRKGENKLFYQRRYDDGALARRLIEPSGLQIRGVTYFGEPYVSFNRCWCRIPLLWKVPLLWLQPLLERCLVRTLDKEQRNRAVGAAITLVKRGQQKLSDARFGRSSYG